MAKPTLVEYDLSFPHKRRNDELMQKEPSRKRLRANKSGVLGLTKEGAERVIPEREQKNEQTQKGKKHR